MFQVTPRYGLGILILFLLLFYNLSTAFFTQQWHSGHTTSLILAVVFIGLSPHLLQDQAIQSIPFAYGLVVATIISFFDLSTTF